MNSTSRPPRLQTKKFLNVRASEPARNILRAQSKKISSRPICIFTSRVARTRLKVSSTLAKTVCTKKMLRIVKTQSHKTWRMRTGVAFAPALFRVTLGEQKKSMNEPPRSRKNFLAAVFSFSEKYSIMLKSFQGGGFYGCNL